MVRLLNNLLNGLLDDTWLDDRLDDTLDGLGDDKGLLLASSMLAVFAVPATAAQTRWTWGTLL